METTIVGARFASGTAKHIIRSLSIGDIIELVHEPENKFDSNAVAAYALNERIGYVARGDAPQIADFLVAGGDVICSVISFRDSLTPFVSVEFLDA